MPWHDPPLRAAGMEVLADGVHEGARWWLQRFDEAPRLQMTLSGFDGAAYVAKQGELAVASPAAVEMWLDRALGEKRASRERQAASVAKREAASPAPVSPPVSWVSRPVSRLAPTATDVGASTAPRRQGDESRRLL